MPQPPGACYVSNWPSISRCCLRRCGAALTPSLSDWVHVVTIRGPPTAAADRAHGRQTSTERRCFSPAAPRCREGHRAQTVVLSSVAPPTRRPSLATVAALGPAAPDRAQPDASEQHLQAFHRSTRRSLSACRRVAQRQTSAVGGLEPQGSDHAVGAGRIGGPVLMVQARR